MRQTSPFSERIERAVKTLETHSFTTEATRLRVLKEPASPNVPCDEIRLLFRGEETPVPDDLRVLSTFFTNGDGPLRRDAARIPFDQTVCERDDSRRAAIVLR